MYPWNSEGFIGKSANRKMLYLISRNKTENAKRMFKFPERHVPQRSSGLA